MKTEKITKILRIITRLNIGGPAIHTILLSSSLNKKRYRDVLVCGSVSDSEGDMIYLAKEKNVVPIVIPELGRDISPFNDLRALLKVYTIIKKEKPDIIHTHTAKAGTLGRLAAILAGVPIKIHTFHGHVFDGYFSPKKARIFLWIERFLAFFTDTVITVSGRVADDIVKRLKVTRKEKCAVIPLGFELDKFLDCERVKGAFRRAHAISPETLLVGIVGRMVPIKNHRMFIDAAKMIKSDFPGLDVTFVIVGDGELKSSIIADVRSRGLEKDVILTGWVEDLASVYADLDVVVLTSLNEGTPVSLIEAMASGKPVIGTDVGGVSDLITDRSNGFLVPSGDAVELARKIALLLESASERKAFGEQGRKTALSVYTKERLVRDIEDLYERHCRKRERNPVSSHGS